MRFPGVPCSAEHSAIRSNFAEKGLVPKHVSGLPLLWVESDGSISLAGAERHGELKIPKALTTRPECPSQNDLQFLISLRE